MNPAGSIGAPRAIAPANWPWLAVGAAMLLLYVPSYVELVRGPWQSEALAHAPLVGTVAFALLWRARRQLVQLPAATAPMLATGGSLSWAADRIKDHGAADITALCVVAAPAGVDRMERDHPDVRVVAAGLDEGLTPSFFIRPGLGDMGDRLFGTL